MIGMSLRDKLIMTAWILGFLTFGLLLTGLWATEHNAEKPVIEDNGPNMPIYQCHLTADEQEHLDAMLDRITSAVPFIEISDNDRYVVECVVAGEAGGHSYPLMKAVAQCMAISMDMRQMSADEVRQEHQYHGYNSALEQTDPYAWDMVCSAVSEIFDDGNFVVYEPI